MLIKIYYEQNLLYSGEVQGPFEMGRQRSGEPLPYAQIPYEGGTRLVIAALQEQAVSRRQIAVEPISESQVRITNLSSTLSIKVEGEVDIPPGSCAAINLPVVMTVGKRYVRIAEDEVDKEVRSLATRTRIPSREESMNSLMTSRSTLLKQDQLRWDQVLEWLRSAMDVLQVTTTSSDFFSTACEAAIGMVGLDSARVLSVDGDDWKMEAVATKDDEKSASWRASRSVLKRVRDERRTFWKSSLDLGSQASSLSGFTSVVAAPIVNEEGKVIAVLYGDRLFSSAVEANSDLSEIDAVLMELLASGIASGLARMQQEQAAMKAQARFEEFFTPRLSRRLMDDQSLLQGQDREVTIFFCDIRGFSRVTERLGPKITVQWLNEMMSMISDAVLDQEGVLVDFNGDEAMGMWGAPETQEDQVERACKAGLTILEKLPELNQNWQRKLDEQMHVGIGINTGHAFVGNIGSHRKFKYGPLGNAVNSASRIQGATKYFQSSMLISEESLKKLPQKTIEQQSRRIRKVKVVNIEEVMSLHELVPSSEPNFGARKELYEKTLNHIEANQREQAMARIKELLDRFPHDGPAQALYDTSLSESLVGKDAKLKAVWTLPGK